VSDYQEPWREPPFQDFFHRLLVDRDGNHVCRLSHGNFTKEGHILPTPTLPSDRVQCHAQRILLCVNACSGLKNSELENLILFSRTIFNSLEEETATFLKDRGFRVFRPDGEEWK
jgi:hypothetical protein